MSLISGLTNHSINTIYSVTTNGYGDVTKIVAYTSVPCRWQERIQKILTEANEEIISKIEVWLLPEYNDILINYQIVKDSETYMIIAKEKKYGLNGELDHIKLYLI